MRTLTRVLAAVAATCVVATALAQAPAADFPRQPVRMVVTFPPGAAPTRWCG
jgi:tripartite-type tricarboxylate transporter receptor subunit TctC